MQILFLMESPSLEEAMASAWGTESEKSRIIIMKSVLF
jgi:hypothetical protein